MLGDMGRSLEDALYLCARDEPCSCSISCGRINSVCRITWSCWIACGNTVVLVEWMDCVWKHCTWRLKYLSLDLLSSSLEIILFTELLYLSGWLDVCRKLLDSTICSPCWRDANTASILTPCWIIGQQTIAEQNWDVVLNETNTDVRMYTWRIYSSRCSHIAVHGWSEYALEML